MDQPRRMDIKFRTFIAIASAFGIGSATALYGVTLLVFIIMGPICGFVAWYWLLFDDYEYPWGFAAPKSWSLWISVLRGNSNLGSAQDNISTVLHFIMWAFAAMLFGFQLTHIFYDATPADNVLDTRICIDIAMLCFLISILAKKRPRSQPRQRAPSSL